MKSTHRRSDFTRRRRISHREAVFHPPERVDFVEKSTCLRKCFFLVGEGGFEPPKALLTDLQSAPFGHSGNPPYKNGAGNRTRTYNLLITRQLLYQLSHTSLLRGYVLLSQAVAHQVPSALKSLTSVFGMGTGVSSLL